MDRLREKQDHTTQKMNEIARKKKEREYKLRIKFTNMDKCKKDVDLGYQTFKVIKHEQNLFKKMD